MHILEHVPNSLKTILVDVGGSSNQDRQTASANRRNKTSDAVNLC